MYPSTSSLNDTITSVSRVNGRQPDAGTETAIGDGRLSLRQGKGDHEIWYSPITDRRFPIDNKIRSRHTANAVLKQAGLPKAFLTFKATSVFRLAGVPETGTVPETHEQREKSARRKRA